MSLVLSERILSLRAAAIAIYDKGYATGKTQEELQKDIEPLQKMMEELVERAAQHCLPDCVVAIQRLESLARAHEEDAKFLIEKAANSRAHAQRVKDAVVKQMKADGVTEKRVGDYVLVLISRDDEEFLTVR